MEQLLAQQQQLQSDVRQLEQESVAAAARLQLIRDEGLAARRNTSLAQQELFAAKQRLADAKLQLNPLNNPQVKKLMHRE